MKKLIAFSLISLLATGCIVSKQTYQTEYNRAREMEAQNEDLTARLGAETRKATMLKTNVVDLETKQTALKEKIGQLEASLEDTSSRLEICMASSDMTAGDLDVARKVLKSAEDENKKLRSDIDQLKAELEKLKKDSSTQMASLQKGSESNIAKLEKSLEQRDAEVEALRSRISMVETDNAVLTEQRDLLEKEKQDKLNELTQSYEGLLENMKDEIAQGQVVISQLQGKLSVQMLNEILFPSGSAQVKAEGRDVLDQVGAALGELIDKGIVIEGHTDNVPIEGTLANRYPSNWELSTARAVSVVRYLTEIAGIDPLRISAVGLGEFHPVADNETKEGRAANRRIEIKLVPIEEFMPPEEEPAEEQPAEEAQAEEAAGEEEQPAQEADAPEEAQASEESEAEAETSQPAETEQTQ